MSELTDDRLEPCPFCGWAITADEGLCKWDKDEFGDTVDEITYTGVCCPGCSAFVPINTKTAAEAIAIWNRRAAASTSTEGAGVIEQCAKIADELSGYTGEGTEDRNDGFGMFARGARYAKRTIAARIRAITPASKVTTDEAEERG